MVRGQRPANRRGDGSFVAAGGLRLPGHELVQRATGRISETADARDVVVDGSGGRLPVRGPILKQNNLDL